MSIPDRTRRSTAFAFWRSTATCAASSCWARRRRTRLGASRSRSLTSSSAAPRNGARTCSWRIVLASGAPLRVRHLEVNGAPQDPAVPLYNAPPDVDVLLIIERDQLAEASEYERLAAAFTPLLDGIATADLNRGDIAASLPESSNTIAELERLSALVQRCGKTVRNDGGGTGGLLRLGAHRPSGAVERAAGAAGRRYPRRAAGQAPRAPLANRGRSPDRASPARRGAPHHSQHRPSPRRRDGTPGSPPHAIRVAASMPCCPQCHRRT